MLKWIHTYIYIYIFVIVFVFLSLIIKCVCLCFRISYSQMNESLGNFRSITERNKKSITIEEFAKYLQVPKSSALEEVFALYDRVRFIAVFS